MNNITDSVEYKRMEEIVLTEIEIMLLKAKLDIRVNDYFKKECIPSERERILQFGLNNYFNNFNMHLPDSPSDFDYINSTSKKDPELEKDLRAICQELTIPIQRKTKEAITILGLNRRKIRDLLDSYNTSKEIGDGKSSERHLELVEYVLPIYVYLRMQGLPHYPDLTG